MNHITLSKIFCNNWENYISPCDIEKINALSGSTPFNLFKWGYSLGVEEGKSNIEIAEKRLKLDFIDFMGDYVEEIKGIELTLVDLQEAPHTVSDCQMFAIEKSLGRIAESINSYIYELKKEPTPTTDQVQK